MRNQTRNKSNSTQQKQVYILYISRKKVSTRSIVQPKKLISVIMIMQGEISLFQLNDLSIG